MACLASIAVAPCPGRIGESVVTALWTRILAAPAGRGEGRLSHRRQQVTAATRNCPEIGQVPARWRPLKGARWRPPDLPNAISTVPCRLAGGVLSPAWLSGAIRFQPGPREGTSRVCRGDHEHRPRGHTWKLLTCAGPPAMN